MSDNRTIREAFNFYRSYYDVYTKLSDKHKVLFMDALLNRQFEGIEPNNLEGMSEFAYISQKHSIDRQIKGWEDKKGVTLHPCQGGHETPRQEEKEKEKEQLERISVKPSIPPQFEDLKNYFFEKLQDEKQSQIQSEKFNDYYEANGWKVGRNKMKDWQAAVRNWIKNIKTYSKENENKPKFSTNR